MRLDAFYPQGSSHRDGAKLVKQADARKRAQHKIDAEVREKQRREAEDAWYREHQRKIGDAEFRRKHNEEVKEQVRLAGFKPEKHRP